MKKTSKLLLSSLPLAALMLSSFPSERPSQAQEPEQTAPFQSAPEAQGAIHRLRDVGAPSPQQATALRRAQLERELVLAERSAQMLLSFGDALSAMARSAQ